MNLTFNQNGFKSKDKPEKPYENTTHHKSSKVCSRLHAESQITDTSDISNNLDLKIDILTNLNDIKLPKSKQGHRRLINDSSVSTNIKSKSDITTPNKSHLIIPNSGEKVDLNSQRIDKVCSVSL